MSLYFVSYDLHNVRTYQPVWDYLNRAGAVKLLESLWLLNTASTAQQVAQGLRAVMDADDSVAVVQLTPGNAWWVIKAMPGGISWLQTNVRSV